jgi:hypothetical protein
MKGIPTARNFRYDRERHFMRDVMAIFSNSELERVMYGGMETEIATCLVYKRG